MGSPRPFDRFRVNGRGRLLKGYANRQGMVGNSATKLGGLAANRCKRREEPVD